MLLKLTFPLGLVLQQSWWPAHIVSDCTTTMEKLSPPRYLNADWNQGYTGEWRGLQDGFGFVVPRHFVTINCEKRKRAWNTCKENSFMSNTLFVCRNIFLFGCHTSKRLVNCWFFLCSFCFGMKGRNPMHFLYHMHCLNTHFFIIAHCKCSHVTHWM